MMNNRCSGGKRWKKTQQACRGWKKMEGMKEVKELRKEGSEADTFPR